jgi:hypothetical protein
MPDLINIRLTKDSPEIEAMDKAAKALGMSRNEMILKAIGMMISFDTVFYKKLEGVTLAIPRRNFYEISHPR